MNLPIQLNRNEKIQKANEYDNFLDYLIDDTFGYCQRLKECCGIENDLKWLDELPKEIWVDMASAIRTFLMINKERQKQNENLKQDPHDQRTPKEKIKTDLNSVNRVIELLGGEKKLKSDCEFIRAVKATSPVCEAYNQLKALKDDLEYLKKEYDPKSNSKSHFALNILSNKEYYQNNRITQTELQEKLYKILGGHLSKNKAKINDLTCKISELQKNNPY